MSRKRKKKNRIEPGSPAAAAAAFDSKISQTFQGVENFVIQRAADIEPQPIQWLWPNRIARGQLTLLAGDSGIGKSLVAIDLAARVSSGTPWPDRPDEQQSPGNVLVLTAHDDPASIGRPRLERAGADLSRVFFATGVDRQEDGKPTWKRQINLTDDLMSLTKAIMAFRPIKLVVIDAAWVFCSRGSSARSKRAGPARLAELAELAAMCQVAIVCVTDLRRDSHAEAGYRAAGDKALLAAAPTEWGLVRDPRKPQQQLMLSLKSNTGPAPAGLGFAINDGRIVWDSQPATISGAAVRAAERSKGETVRADDWLQAFLAAGPRPQKEVIRQGKECGFSEWKLRRAKMSLRAHAQRVGPIDDGRWIWMSDAAWQAFREGREAGLGPEIVAASEEFESVIDACGEKGEQRDENGERNGACAESRIFDDIASSSNDLGVFCEDVVMAGAASSAGEPQHLRDRRLDDAGRATEVDREIWDRERHACGGKGKEREEKGERNGAHAESHIFDAGASSSNDLGVFCEDAVLAGAASSGSLALPIDADPPGCRGDMARGDPQHLRDLPPDFPQFAEMEHDAGTTNEPNDSNTIFLATD